ncbi:MAG TPA: hypothetical protein VFO46_23755 [Candidatus Sulfotelmatobacter sp.]|nr:hypothetical protein [Candidatus Sulfotelmatobacter sp.]
MKRSATQFAVVAVLIFVLHGNFLKAQETTAISQPTPTIAGAQEESGTASVASSDNLPDAPSSQQQAQTQTQNQNQTPSQNQSQTQGQNQPQNQRAPSLEDLGFSKAEEQGNARQQALLDKRTHMLKIHQRMGLITTIPMIASVVTSLNAGGRSEGTAARDLHVALGALTGDLYGITAYYAIRAPKIEGTETRGPIKFHKIMAWIHGPGMIATPILGALAFSQKNNGERVHGIAQAHGPVAIVTAGAFGAALLSVSLKF